MKGLKTSFTDPWSPKCQQTPRGAVKVQPALLLNVADHLLQVAVQQVHGVGQPGGGVHAIAVADDDQQLVARA